MKCEYCNGTLSFEEEYCPHCGQRNKHAQQHIKDMLHYQGEFETTKKDIHETTKGYSRNMVQLVMITVLVILAVVMIFVSANAYSFCFDYMDKKAERNVEKYTAVMDEYIKAEDFRRLYLFCEEKYISGYDEAYSHYSPVIRAATDYYYFCESLVWIMESQDMGYDSSVESMCNYLNNFYYCMDMSHFDYMENADRKENIEALEVMELYIKRMLQSYCHFTEEELDGFKDLSDAKRTVLIEEKIGNEE